MSAERARLTVTEGDATTLSVTGELDAHTAPALAERLAATDAAGSVTIDLAGLDFMDSSGLRVVIEAHQRSADAGGSLVLVNPSRSVERLLTISGLDGHLDVR